MITATGQPSMYAVLLVAADTDDVASAPLRAQTITVTLPRRPVLAGIDPRHLLDWEEREDDDNIAAVQVQIRETTALRR